MELNYSDNNKYTKDYRHQEKADFTLGVENQLRRYALNEYLNSGDENVLIGTDQGVPDNDLLEDDMLLTNAITENVVQDQIDKKRYFKEIKSYVTINSGARNTSKIEVIGDTESSLTSTGTIYINQYSFAPYSIVVDQNGDPIYINNELVVMISVNSNHIQFSLQDWTNYNSITQILTPSNTEIFDVYLSISNQPITLSQLKSNIETNLNLVAATGIGLDNSEDKDHMFTVEVLHDSIVNSDRATVNIQCQHNFHYIMTFYPMGDLPTNQIISSEEASNESWINNNPNNVFPYPNNYALFLNKAYNHVKSIRIIASEIPNTDTIINSYNNHITFQLINKSLPVNENDPESQNIKTKNGSIDWDVYLPYGNYNLSQLLNQIEIQINVMLFGEANLSNVFTVTGSELSGIVEISVNDPYLFKWNFNENTKIKWRNLYQMLGFKDSKMLAYASKFNNTILNKTGSGVLRCPYRAITLKKSHIVWMHLNNYETIYDTRTNTFYFCRFNLNNVPDGQYAYDTFTPSVHIFNDAPLPVLNKIDVRIYDEMGMPYNFNGVDHSFTLEIVHYIDRLMGTDHSSRRGMNDKTNF
ncbi:MAG: hypothetical protein ABIN35_00280 [candidate division WOR-3 bacterium]